MTGIGIGVGAGVALAKPPPPFVFETETNTLVAAMSVAPTFTRKLLINTVIAGLKADGVFTLIDDLLVFAAHDAQAGLLNWKNPATFVPTLAHGAGADPTFVADRGYTTDGTQNFINLNYNPTTAGGNLTQNAASFSEWNGGANAQGANAEGGWFDGTDGIQATARTAADAFTFRINQAALSTVAASPDSRHLFAANRSAAGATQAYIDGAAQTVGTNPNQASTALNNHVLQLGAVTAALFSARTFVACSLGGNMSAAQHLALFTRLHTFLQAIGAVP